MSMFEDPGLFGRLWANGYDSGNPDPAAAVDFLADLSGGRRVLELAIGSGRVALPLAARGIPVEGVEASPEMVALMREKPGGAEVPVVIADMADVPVQGPYSLVYQVYNTLFNLTQPGRQADCFRNVARVLAPGGAFVIETYVPDEASFAEDERVQMRSVTDTTVVLRLHEYDRQAQTFVRQTVTLDGQGVHLAPFAMHYLWPGQIDALAADAGLRLHERYAGFDRRPFDATSTSHVSVYRSAGV
jgi:SAM-dependent methyltransferase